MKYLKSPTLLSLILSAVAFTAFLFWYRGDTSPLTPNEVEQFLHQISSQDSAALGSLDLPALRIFLEEDDGKPFYMVNLLKFHDQAQYLDGRNTADTGKEANEKFAREVLILLLKRGGHPVFGSNWIAPAVAAGDWDQVGVVRHRSRRDLAEMFASEAFAAIAIHKWAAIEANIRLPVQGIGIPPLYLLFLVLILLLVVLVQLLDRR